MKSIIFVSYYPNENRDREGMRRRINSIDQLFAERNRTYLEINQKEISIVKIEKSEKFRLNIKNTFFNMRFWVKELFNSEIVYIHSIYNCLNILPFYFFLKKKIIIDLHGIVPEETSLNGDLIGAFILNFYEKFFFKRANHLIVVSNEMKNFIKIKYPKLNLDYRIIEIPIIDTSNTSGLNFRSDSNQIRVVYAGGTQKWQNFDRMIESIHAMNSKYPQVFDFYIFVPNECVESTKIMVSGITNIHIGSLPRNELLKVYSEMDLGFILRDNHIVNNVAMPTKLIEYLEYGIVPIVLSKNVGDYKTYHMQSIELEALLTAITFDKAQLRIMAVKNLEIVDKLKSVFNNGVEKLKLITL